MKLAKDLIPVERSGDFQETTFRIKASSAAFEILSSRLYQNIPLAIIRELSTNAHDAHVEAGKPDVPFSVTLPNVMSPMLKIRDFGPGLTHEQMLEVYSTYFESTRSESNAYTGALGLGSKVPFAYTSNFNVTSYQKGQAKLYAMFKGEEGLPKVALMSVGETSEPDGLEISLAIESRDISHFVHAAAQVYPYFNPPPTITGAHVDLQLTDKVLEGEGWAVRQSGNLVAIMGNIAYPISPRELLDPGIAPTRGELYFKIGELDVTASREDLHYSERTKKAIHERLTLMRGLYVQLAEEKLKAAESIFQALQIANETFWDRSAPFANIFRSRGKTTLIWNGLTLQHGLSINLRVPGLETRQHRLDGGGRGYSEEIESWSFWDHNIPVVYYGDLNYTVGKNAISYHLRNGGDQGEKVIVFHNPPPENGGTALSKEEAIKRIKAIGIPESMIRFLSDLGKPVRQARDPNLVTKKRHLHGWKIAREVYWRRHGFRQVMTPADIDPSVPGIYFPVHDKMIQLKDGKQISPVSAVSVANLLRKHHPQKPIYAINEKWLPKFLKATADTPGWSHVSDVVREAIEKELGSPALRIRAIKGRFDERIWRVLSENVEISKLKFEPLRKALEAVREDLSESGKEVRDTMSVLGITVQEQLETAKLDEDAVTLRLDVDARYPLLGHISWYGTAGEVSTATLCYIEAIDLVLEKQSEEKKEG